MKIAIGSDHAGFDYKERIRDYLKAEGHEVKDFGTRSPEPCAYPLFVRAVAQAVAAGQFERGIVLGGTGIGDTMVANRIRGVRCSLCWDLRSAALARKHNDANVLALGQRMLSIEEAMEIVLLWLQTAFDVGRHAERVRMIDQP